MKTLFSTLLLFILLISCNGKKEMTLVSSSGRMNNLLIVIDNKLWNGAVGDSLREIITTPVLGLPQEEAQFSIIQVSPDKFGNIFRTNRNLLFVGIDSTDSYGVKNNIYAQPQVAMTITGTDNNTLLSEISKHKKDIIDVYKAADLNLFSSRLTSDHWDMNKIKTMSQLGFELKIPINYSQIADTGDFLWYRQNIAKGSMNIIAYALPMPEKDSIVKNIVRARDTIGKKYIPGQFDGTYMITEAAFTPFTVSTQIDGKKAYETRGTWEVKGDFMAGPFLNYTVVDSAHNRLLVVEGFTFAPSTEKRDYMFELEAILKTLKIGS